MLEPQPIRWSSSPVATPDSPDSGATTGIIALMVMHNGPGGRFRLLTQYVRSTAKTGIGYAVDTRMT